MDVDAGLSASRYAEEQRRGGLSAVSKFPDTVINLVLSRIQLRQRQKLVAVHLRPTKHFALIKLNQPLLFQRLHRGPGGIGMCEHIMQRQRLKTAQDLQDAGLLHGAALCFLSLRCFLRRNGKTDHRQHLVLGPALALVVEPEPGRKNRLDRVINRTEKSVAHKQCELDLRLGQDRSLIQKPDNRF